MKFSGIKHEGKGVTKGAPPAPKCVANGVPGAAAPVPAVAVGVELVVVGETEVLVAQVVAAEEVGVLEVAPPALVTVAVAVVAVATVFDIVLKKLKRKSNYLEFFAFEVVKLRTTATWVHDSKGVSKVVRQDSNISSPNLSWDWEKDYLWN